MKTTPFQHQRTSFDFSKELAIYAVWWEQGTGKSKLIIDTACHLYASGLITGLLIIAPNGVHGNFISQEMPVHSWAIYQGFIYHSGRAGTKKAKARLAEMMERGPLRVLAMSYDAVCTKAGYEAAFEFLSKHVCKMVLDESTAIAEPTTKRSKALLPLGQMAKYRRVMSGTPVAEGPFKIFNQMRWLDPDYWKKHGLNNYFAFKQTFAIFKTQRASAGHQFQQLLQYRNLDYLQKLVAAHSTRVLKEDVLDLPPKLYSKIEFDLEEKQRKIYDDLVDSLVAEIDAGQMLEATTALVRLTRLQQITSGYVVVDITPPTAVGDIVILQCEGYSIHGEITELGEDGTGKIVGRRLLPGQLGVEQSEGDWCEPLYLPEMAGRMVRLVEADQHTLDLFAKPGDNPRLRALLATLEPITHKVIIWARYRKDIDLIIGALGDAAVRYDGIVGTHDREIALDRFRNDPKIQYFVANPQTLSMGVTLTQAKTVIYYSNSFQLEKRLQSEDRAHRIGQDVSVNIIDIVASDTVDGHIVKTLRKKFDLAATVTGDRLREWVR